MGFLKERLDNTEIRKELQKLKPKIKEDRINEVIQQFWFDDLYNSLISFPPYLKHLKKFFLIKGNRKFPRIEFYDFFLGEVIGKASKKIKPLQKIATAMELMQTNDLPIKGFKELLKRLEIDPDKLGIKRLVAKNLIKRFQEEDKPKSIGFYHHTIQEFLAACYILDTKNPLKTAQSFMVLRREKIVVFKPSWYGVLRFLFESQKGEEFIRWIVGFALKHKETVDDSSAAIITSIDPQIAPDLKTKIFNLIYDEYFNRKLWLPVWARHQLGKFCTSEHLRNFKEDIKPTKNKTETFVHQGNIAAIIDGILQNNPKLLTSKEKLFWKKKLVEFANDENKNGVLQRHSLSALVNYKDPDLISKADKAFSHEDRLVKEEFLQFCYRTDPNNHLTIDYLVESIEQGFAIYGRHGLYEVNSKDGIVYLLEKFLKDKKFLKRFLERESIFNTEKEKGDQELLNHIKNVADKKIISLLKKIIYLIFSSDKIYEAHKSYFLHQLASLVLNHDVNYLMEILDEISKYKKDQEKIWRLLWNYQSIFAVLIQKRTLAKFFKRVSGLHKVGFSFAEVATSDAKGTRGKEGQKIYDYALKRKLMKPYKVKKISKEQRQEKEKEIYKEFLRLLEPRPGKYFPTVFSFYLNNREVIEKKWRNGEKKRLIKLVTEGLNKINPTKIKVRISDKSRQDRKYIISSVASCYGDILRVGQVLFPKKLAQYRQNIINFIPYAYFNNQRTILEIIKTISDKDIIFVNEVYQNKEDDRRYLLPNAYIYVVGEYSKRGCKLNSSQRVLKSFISDKYISQSDQISVLERLGEFASKDDLGLKAYFSKVFEQNKEKKIGEIANAVLIKIFKDEKAINWRFNELKKRIKPFTPSKSMAEHFVGPLEDEFSRLHFARPLIELRDTKHLPKFLDLLEFSFNKLKEPEEKKLWSYINYLWRIVIEFVDRLKEKGSFDPVARLEEWVKERVKFEGSNWFKGRIDQLYTTYIEAMGRAKAIDDAVLQIKAVEEK